MDKLISEKQRLELIAKVVTRIASDMFGPDGPKTWKAAAETLDIPKATFDRVRLGGRALHGTYIEVERRLHMPKGILTAIRTGDLEDIAELAPKLPEDVRDLVLSRMGLAPKDAPVKTPQRRTRAN